VHARREVVAVVADRRARKAAAAKASRVVEARKEVEARKGVEARKEAKATTTTATTMDRTRVRTSISSF